MTFKSLIFSMLLGALPCANAQTPLKDVMLGIDPSTGKARDTSKEFATTGIVAARITLPDGKVAAFVLNAGEPALTVTTDAKGAEDLIPRNAINLAGKLEDGPFGAALRIKAGSVSVTATNQPFGMTETRGAEFFKDASALAGRYVQLTNVSFVAPKFDAAGVARVRNEAGAEAVLLVSKSVADHLTPAKPVNVYGIPVKWDGKWALVAARLLPVNGRATLALATKHTCVTCHNPDQKIIGPAYRSVAAKYRNDPEASAKLVAQMENGGSGKWGPVPMVPFKGKVPPEDMRQLADWILGYRWDALLAE